MASFLKRLETLLSAARQEGLLDEETSTGLLGLAEQKEKGRGLLSLAAVLGWLGASVAAVGVVLLVSANWESVSDGVKIFGLLLALALAHGTGLWISFTGRDLPKTAEALHFLGAGLFFAGIGLVAQIYNLNESPPNGVLAWLVAIVPLAVLLRSPSITLMSIFALLLWGHLVGEFSVSRLRLHHFTGHLMLEIGLGTALIGFSPFLRPSVPAIARVFRATGTFLLFGTLYLLTFFRHFSEVELNSSKVLPLGALFLGGLGLALGSRRLAPVSGWFHQRLILLLSLLLLLAFGILAADVGWLPRGERLEFFNFGHTQSFDYAEWGFSMAAWALWFLLALWCVGFGGQSGRKGYLNTGVVAVGLGVLTLFFDLIGSLATTGTVFLLGGLVLLGTGFGMERWRRKLLARMASPNTSTDTDTDNHQTPEVDA